MNRSRPIPSLDGIRALSIAMVAAGHLVRTRHFGVPQWVAGVDLVELAQLGVRVFFVISGFLITSLLLRELDEHGRIRLGRFYFRRTLRIFPPYYGYILALVAAHLAWGLTLSARDVFHAATYTSNYAPGGSWYIGHSWSLSVEEQFYLLWPAALLLLGRRRGIAAAAAVLVACPLIRVAEFSRGILVGLRFETVADALAAGCVLAGVGPWLRERPAYARALASPWFALVPAAVLYTTTCLSPHPRVFYLVGYTLMNLGIAASIDWCVTHHDGLVGRFLNCAPVAFIGVISYSIYLWQQPFLNRHFDSFATSFPLNVVLAGAAAVASYFLIERPSLALRGKLEARFFPGR